MTGRVGSITDIPYGRVFRVISCAGISTPNVAYGGPDGRTLYITESQTGSILQAKMPAPGQTLFSHS